MGDRRIAGRFKKAVNGNLTIIPVKGITQRWIFNNLSVLVAVICVISMMISVLIRTNYYDYIRAMLSSNIRGSGMVDSHFKQYIEEPSDNSEIKYDYYKEFPKGAKAYIERFTSKSLMEVWIINKDGTVIVSSSGFLPEGVQNMEDYNQARQNPQKARSAEWIGKNPSGEKIMAVSYLLVDENDNQRGAVRYMTSLSKADEEISKIIAIIASVSVVTLLMIIISSSFFIRSIVNPLKEIGANAKLVAQGNFDVRIDKPYNDEVGELCDTINDMAAELGATEKMKNDFISTVSHELRTPLTAIKGWGETLKSIGETDRRTFDKGLDVIIKESARLSGIVEELLDFSKIQSGRLNLRLEKMDVLAELDETVYALMERAKRDGIELAYSVPDFPAPMTGDPDRIKQVFVNILDNALKYTEKGGKVYIAAELEEEKIRISIKDTGCGIASEDLPRIKEKFYKANQNVRGSGIGLAICEEVVNQHNGQIIIDSELGEGTTVTIYLPANVAPIVDVTPIAEMSEEEIEAISDNLLDASENKEIQ